MQPRVSMVMPCYNKVEYIGEMFDSIIEQTWNNIEIILVNDGSNDGTREVIAGYEAKFRARGFETIIIDQQNAGVCAAAKAGLAHMTGEYVCTVDADDELDPEYVATLAGFLQENEAYDFAVCDGVRYTGSGNQKQFQTFNPSRIADDDPYLVERWLFGDFTTPPWIYMIRTAYFRKCRIFETYYTQIATGSHEPGYIIPLLAYGGKFKYFPRPLYHFNFTETSHSRFDRFERAQQYCDEYNMLCAIAIEALPAGIADFGRKSLLKKATAISNLVRLYILADKMRIASDRMTSILGNIVEYANDLFSIDPPMATRDVCDRGAYSLFKEMQYALYGRGEKGRVIVCRAVGTLSTANVARLACLKGTHLEQTEFWDVGDSDALMQHPELSGITSADTIIAMWADKPKCTAETIQILKETGCILILFPELWTSNRKSLPIAPCAQLPLVSIVMPCYNKLDFISSMFNSILIQTWSNIELILVNDGSTDGTREIITDWLPKFREHGIAVVVVDQENRGLPGAVHEGLKRATGEFICQVDADDELDPEYVATLAGWLTEHPEYDWAVCDMLYVYERRVVYHSYLANPATPEHAVFSHLAESFLLYKIKEPVHEYMVRAEYMKRSGLLENYFSDVRRTQEPQYVITLAAAGGRLKHIPLPLYRYMQNDQMMSIRKTYEDFREYYEQYFVIVHKTIEGLRAENRNIFSYMV